MKTFKFSIWRNMLSLLFAVLLFSCNKQNQFLDALPNENLAIPNKLADLQLMIQADGLFNRVDGVLWSQESCDDMYVLDSYFISNKVSNQTDNNVYTWAQNIYTGPLDGSFDWSSAYSQIYYANIILESLAKINPTNAQINQYNSIKGSALFFRAKAFYDLLQEFAKPYIPATAGTDLGIPLRLSSDFNKKYPRASVQASYEQVISDLKSSTDLLPNTSAYLTLPNKVSANGFFARVYLAMADYKNAFSYADASLSTNSNLTDYNTLTPGIPLASAPLVEDIFHSIGPNGSYASFSKCFVDSGLYASYDNNDLRKSILFYKKNPFYSFWGTYDVIQTNQIYDGIATDELYLIRAECNARLGNVSPAMKDLNTLLVNRYLTNTFVARTAADATDAVKQILTERRKELIWRGLRWTDLRRLNQDPQFAITLKRVINGVTYTLPPNDPRYVLPITPQEIQLTGIPQNQR